MARQAILCTWTSGLSRGRGNQKSSAQSPDGQRQKTQSVWTGLPRHSGRNVSASQNNVGRKLQEGQNGTSGEREVWTKQSMLKSTGSCLTLSTLAIHSAQILPWCDGESTSGSRRWLTRKPSVEERKGRERKRQSTARIPNESLTLQYWLVGMDLKHRWETAKRCYVQTAVNRRRPIGLSKIMCGVKTLLSKGNFLLTTLWTVCFSLRLSGQYI